MPISVSASVKTALFCLLLISCTPTSVFDREQATQEILQLHHLQRDYHFDKMAEDFAELLSDQHISVNRGEVGSPTKKEHLERFQAYFDSVEFEKWDDLTEPVIRFSDDGSMAYTVVHKEVIVRHQNEEGETQRDKVEYAWVAIYKRYPEGWKIDCVASTNKPVVTETAENN